MLKVLYSYTVAAFSCVRVQVSNVAVDQLWNVSLCCVSCGITMTWFIMDRKQHCIRTHTYMY